MKFLGVFNGISFDYGTWVLSHICSSCCGWKGPWTNTACLKLQACEPPTAMGRHWNSQLWVNLRRQKTTRWAS